MWWGRGRESEAKRFGSTGRGDVGSLECGVLSVLCYGDFFSPKGAALTCLRTTGKLVEEEGLLIVHEREILVVRQ